MRFLIGSFEHESNGFCEGLTGLVQYQQHELAYGNEIINLHKGKKTRIGGFIDVLEQGRHEIIPSVLANALPSGPIEGRWYQEIKNRFVDDTRKAGKLDGVLLSLHGAMSVEPSSGVDDPEGTIVAEIRQVVGPGVPIVVAFDLHSDTTDLLLQNADITLCFNEEPHRDDYDRGVEAAQLIQRIIKSEIHPVHVRERVPMLLPAINMATDIGPMHELHKLRAKLEGQTGVIDISIHAGFYGSDQPEAGFSVVCTTDGDIELARRLAQQVAVTAWQKREEFLVNVIPINVAVQQAVKAGYPVGLIDEADDPAGGGSADSVAILCGLLEGGVKRGGISTVKDTEVARAMAKAGEGAILSVLLGGKTDSLHGESLQVTGRVVKVHRKPIPADTWSEVNFDAGIVAVLDIHGILVVVTEYKLITENINIFDVLGFDVTQMQAVGFKGLGLHIRQALKGKINHFIPVDGVGVTHPDVRKLGTFRKIKRPVWPLDDMPLNAYPNL